MTTIGAGGMGQVLKVQDTRSGQYYALKIHYSPTDKEAVLLTYRREHRAMSRCDHPNVIRSFESGVHEGCPYLVMEFVDGAPLTDFLKERDLRPGPERDKMAALLGIQIASALDHIHSRNLVHLDLKPANILVTPDEKVKLIDFGIARELDADRSRHRTDAVGTYAFCSPEQVTGAPCDHRSDLYSFGVVMYLLLTGELPFVAEEAIAYILKHVNEPPVPLEACYPNVPPPLRDVVLRLLEKEPLARPQSGREVERVLKVFVEEAWRKEGLAAPLVVPVETAPEVRLFEPAFVGRENARRRLAGSVSLLQAGVGGIDVILGEPGMGKGQLMNDALSGARARGIAVFTARCHQGASRPFHGLVELLEALVAYLLRREVNLVQVELGAHLPVLARAFPPVAALLPAHSPAVGDAAPHVERERLTEALQAFLDAILPGPTVLALRELQWADSSSLDLLETVALRGPDAGRSPVLLVGTISTPAQPESTTLKRWCGDGPPLVETLELRPLSEPEVGKMIDSMLGGHIDLGPVGTILYQETRGIPLHVLEAIRMMVDRGDLAPHAVSGDDISGWTLLVPDESETVEDLGRAFGNAFRERVALLPDTPRRLLEQMAVLGRPCTYPWLRLVTPVTEDELLDLLDHLMARRILVEMPAGHNSLFWFYHPWMAKILRESLVPAITRKLHRVAAEAWTTVHGDGDTESLEMVALHLFDGHAFAKAGPLLVKAAATRFKLGLHDECRPLLEKAIEAAGHAPEVEPGIAPDAHLLLGRLERGQATYERTSSHLRTAAARAEEAGKPEIQGKALSALAELAADRGDHRTACVQFSEAIKVLRDGGARDSLVWATLGLASSMWYQGDFDVARKCFADALIAANKLNDNGLASRAVHGLGLVAVQECRLKQAIKHFSEAANLSRAWGRDTFFMLCQRDEAQVRALTGDLETASSLAARSLEALEQTGQAGDLAGVHATLAAIAIERRDLETAQAQVDAMTDALKHEPNQYLRCMKHLLLGQLALARGKPKVARVAAGEAIDLARAGRYRPLEARARRFAGAALIHLGSIREGIITIRRSLSATEKLGDVPGILEARLFYAEGLVVRGDREEAWEVLADIKPRLRAAGLRLLLVRALALSARLASMARNPKMVRAHVHEAFKLVHEIRKDMPVEACALFDTRPEIRLLVTLRRE